MKILMVCLGNYCRSPLAEGILRYKINERKLAWITDSAGTGDYHIDKAPHRLSQKVAIENGIDISGLRGRQFRKEDMLRFDKIYAMDLYNYEDIKTMSSEYWDASKTDLILNEIFPGVNREVPDPWYGGEEDFNAVFKMLDTACNAIIKKYAVASAAM
ncbi:MAG TPA: low molecular weight protein-tyrosine-phosphatase [Chitinophagaceae bacterium]|nr:low molecular weight protein-tyrosine-phosphatase [Chitinophagaceae bacterium]